MHFRIANTSTCLKCFYILKRFGENFETEGGERVVMGMVGNGPMQQAMILSQHVLRQGTSLIKQTVIGIREVLMQHQYILPWLDLAHKHIREIMKNRSDINPYGATNQAELLAVAAEYFFERPDHF